MTVRLGMSCLDCPVAAAIKFLRDQIAQGPSTDLCCCLVAKQDRGAVRLPRTPAEPRRSHSFPRISIHSIAEDAMAYWEPTQELLQGGERPLVIRPKLDAKLLQKPPFRLAAWAEPPLLRERSRLTDALCGLFAGFCTM